MKDRYLILISIVLVILQSSIGSYIAVLGVQPSLPLVFLISGTVVFGHAKGLRIAVYLGLTLDILIGKGLGVYTSLFLIISFVISSIEEKIFKDNYITPLILIIGASVFTVFYFSLFHYLSTSYVKDFAWLSRTLLVYTIYNVFLGVPIYTVTLRRYIGYGMR